MHRTSADQLHGEKKRKKLKVTAEISPHPTSTGEKRSSYVSAIRSKLVPGGRAELGFSLWLQHDSKVTGVAQGGLWHCQKAVSGEPAPGAGPAGTSQGGQSRRHHTHSCVLTCTNASRTRILCTWTHSFYIHACTHVCTYTHILYARIILYTHVPLATHAHSSYMCTPPPHPVIHRLFYIIIGLVWFFFYGINGGVKQVPPHLIPLPSPQADFAIAPLVLCACV